MADSRGVPNPSGMGRRQKRAAQLRAEMEGTSQKASDDNRDDDSDAAEKEKQAIEGAGPVGTGDYIVKQGECISSIAKGSGHLKETIWQDPANRELRDTRKDSNVLLEGDRIHIPPLRPKEESGKTEMRHRFVRMEKEMLRLRILDGDKPRGNEPYTLSVDGAVSEGTTDAEGKIECPIPANARVAKLTVGGEKDSDDFIFDLGKLDPITELAGVQGRLKSLGFDCGPIDGKWGPRTERGIKTFQAKHKLSVTGRPDDETRSKLESAYGC